MKKYVLASLAATLLMTGTAFAADLYVPVAEDVFVPTATDVSWSGFYVGANVGYGWANALQDGDENDSSELDGWLGGVQAGYNYNLGGVVLGVEADIAYAGIDEGDDADHFDPEDGINWLGTVRGRVGFALDSLLLYGTGGIAFAGIETFGDSQTLTGWVVGAGAEYMVSDNLSLKAEYLYHDFGSNFIDGFGDDFDVNAHTVKAGINFHF